MCKVTFGILIFILCWSQAYTQRTMVKQDSLRIEMLKKRLPHLSGTTRVDCLNDIARQYIYIERTGNRYQQNWHAAYYYSKLAYKEAIKIGYKYGEAFSLMEIGYHMRVSPAAENYIQQAISIGNKLKSNKILGWAYLKLSWQDMSNRPLLIDRNKKALYYLEKAGDTEGQTEAALFLAQEYLWNGNYQEAFLYCEKALSNARKMGIHNLDWRDDCLMESLLAMSQLYERAGDYNTAMEHLREAQKYGTKIKSIWKMESDIGQLYDKMGKHDSAFYYLKLFADIYPGMFYSKMWIGENYFATKQYEKALTLFKEADALKYKLFQSQTLLLNYAAVYEANGNHDTALAYASKGLALNCWQGANERL